MAASQRWLEITANNLANASTTGFKREAAVFNESLLRSMAEDGGRGRVLGELGSGPLEQATMIVFEAGAITKTGSPLDAAIRGAEGLFAVETDQGVRYTRSGAFAANQAGELATLQGFPVLDAQGQRIRLQPGDASIQADGTVISRGQRAGQIAVFWGSFKRFGEGLYESADAQPMPRADLVPGAIEQSNVNAIEEMVTMIKVNRAFEMAQRSITSHDESTGRLMEILRGA
jgi:flagellar basal body rod protein FlgG